ncbi:hypothetical protein EV424DRAFT_737479 [Suillus variegatus]|nr:hypothetical protein EV424DRAFT_737479 [Suillus variegatus]
MPTTERPATEKPTTERPTTDRSFLDVDATAPSDQFGGVDELSSTFFADIDSGSPMGGAHPHSRVNALLAHLSSHLHRFRPKNGEATELPQPSRLSAFHPHSLHTRLSSLIHRSSPENDASDELQQPSTPSLLNPHVLLARLSSFLPPPPLNAHKEAEPHPTTPLSSSPDGLISSLSSRFRSQPHTNEGIELPQRPSRPRVVAVAAVRDKQTLVVARGPYFQKAKRAYEQQTQLHSQAQASSSHTEPATASMYAMRPAPACTAAAQPLVIEWWTKIVLFLCCCASPANSS